MEIINELLSLGALFFAAVYLLIINLIGFAAIFIDKRLAIAKKRRISEKALLTIAFIGGSYGVYIGMYTFRHKTKHKKFTITVPVFIIIQSIAIFYFCFR